MTRAWPLLRAYGLDLLVVAAALEGTLVVAFSDSASAPQTTRWFTVPATAAMILPLLARRRLPFAVPLAVWLLGIVLSSVDGRLIPFSPAVSVAGMAGAFLLGCRRSQTEAWVGLGAVLAGAGAVVYNDPSHGPTELFFVPLLFSVGWLAGYGVRERAEQADAAELRAAQAERERDSASRLAVAEERARIARELHDIVAHSVSVMVLQVGAVRHKLPDELTEDRDALTGVERTGRTALAEMRRLLAAMRSDGDDVELGPQPGLDRLDALIADVDRAGLPVRLHVEGEPFPLPRALDLSAYRIVQEGLTNALKHAHAGAADVTLHYAPDELRIEVRDDGTGGSPRPGNGHGLVGIRERVKIYGGAMSAGAAPQGGFVLSTWLPVGGGS